MMGTKVWPIYLWNISLLSILVDRNYCQQELRQSS